MTVQLAYNEDDRREWSQIRIPSLNDHVGWLGIPTKCDLPVSYLQACRF